MGVGGLGVQSKQAGTLLQRSVMLLVNIWGVARMPPSATQGGVSRIWNESKQAGTLLQKLHS
eukprot:1160020-Pelagomonas_calceolata.AAC.2